MTDEIIDEIHSPRRSGMTLMELMVVVTIMLLVVAISVPTLRPMLESRQARDGAESVRSYLLRARMRAMETGRPCGVMLERFDTSPDACLVLRQVEVPPPYSGMGSNERVDVTHNGVISSTTATNWSNLDIGAGCQIQFNYQGPYYEMGSSSQLNLGRHRIPDLTDATYKIIRKPRATLTPPLIMPHEMVVDLNYSGMTFPDDLITGNWRQVGAPGVDTGQNTFWTGDNIIMFSSNGSVQQVSRGTSSNVPSSPIYLLIGRWDRTGVVPQNGGADLTLLPEDKLFNFDDLSNYWVVINPSNGNVTTAEMAASTMADPDSSVDIKDRVIASRRFASEQR